jgi:hypothetical protein
MVPQDQQDWVSSGARFAVMVVKDEIVINDFFSKLFNDYDAASKPEHSETFQARAASGLDFAGRSARATFPPHHA